jgi:hypothetical protein
MQANQRAEGNSVAPLITIFHEISRGGFVMGTVSNKLQQFTRQGTLVALLSALTIFLFAGAANLTAQTSIILSQNATYAALPGGGTMDGGNPAGGSMAVNSLGVVVAGDTYGGDLVEFAPPTYAATTISPDTGNNISGVAIDSSNFLYISDQQSGNIVKVPMNANGTYTITADPAGAVTSLQACAGDTKTPDTAGECIITNPLTALGTFGVDSMTISTSGIMYFATSSWIGGSAGTGLVPYSIYKCNALCLYGTTAPTLIYAEDITPAGDVATQGQYYIGGIALDSFGNLFFTDSAETNGSLASAASHLYEMPVATKAVNPANTGFVATPIAVLTMTNSSPGDYDNVINAVATDTRGHVYAGVIYNGVYGLVDNGSLDSSSTGTATVSGSSLYGIANQDQVKLLASDNNGNFYAIGNGATNAGNLYFISTGPVKFSGAETVGTPETASATVADNTEACTPTLTFTSSDPAFTGIISTTGTCNGMFQITGSFTPVTLTYTPTATGFVSGSLTVTDTTSSASSAPESLSSSGAAITISQLTWGPSEKNSAALYGTGTVSTSGGDWGSDSADGHSGAVNSSGVFLTGTSYGGGGFVEQFTNNASAMTVVGNSGIGAGGLAIDSNNFLYISGEYSNVLYKLPMNTTTNGIYGPGSYGPMNSAVVNGNTVVETASGGTPPTCVGDSSTTVDQAGVCQINLGNGDISFAVSSLVFDKNGNLFFTTDDKNPNTSAPDGSAEYSLLECGPTCLYGASPTDPVLLFAEPPAANGAQLYVGGVAVDQNDNVYFSDSSVSTAIDGGDEYSLWSDLYQLTYNSGSSTYAATPTLLETLTPACPTPLAGCSYNEAITTVITDATGNIYFGGPGDGSGNPGGLFEIANNGSALQANPPVIPISGQGVKTIALAGNGNFYFVDYNNNATGGANDSGGFLTVGSVAVTAMASPGSPATATASAVDTGATCYDGQDELTITENSTDYGFSGAESAGSNCGTLPFESGTSFPVTITFNPTASASGAVSTTVTATNSNSGDTGTAAVSGTAALAQPVVLTGITSPIVYGAESSYTLGVTGNTSGNSPTFTIASGNTAGASITGDTLTYTSAGAFTIDIAVAGGTVGSTTYAPFSGSVAITVDQASQTITFSPAASAAYGATVQLSATGGASGNPVTFTLDASSTAGAATLTGSTLKVTGLGSIVVDANQEGDTDYAAATQVQATINAVQAAQVITFTTPSGSSASKPASITFGANVTLAATGGASGAAVTFTVDASSTAGAGSLNGSTLTASGLGTIVIDANQAGNTDYAAATQVQAFFTVAPLGTLTAPTISPASGNTLSTSGTGNNLVTITAATGTAIYYTTDGSTPTTASTQYTAAFALTTTGSVTVNAIAAEAGYATSTEATATYTVVSTAPAFTASSSSGTSSSPITITSSTPGTLTLTLTPSSGFDQQISFSCTGSTGITISCTFSPTTVTPSGNDQTIPVNVSISKGSGSALLQKGTNPFLPGGATLAAIAFCFLGWKKRRGLLLALVLIVGAIAVGQLSGCGGPSSKTGTVAIAATGGGTTVTTTVNVVVK